MPQSCSGSFFCVFLPVIRPSESDFFLFSSKIRDVIGCFSAPFPFFIPIGFKKSVFMLKISI